MNKATPLNRIASIDNHRINKKLPSSFLANPQTHICKHLTILFQHKPLSLHQKDGRLYRQQLRKLNKKESADPFQNYKFQVHFSLWDFQHSSKQVSLWEP